jgi:hypothetical protein
MGGPRTDRRPDKFHHRDTEVTERVCGRAVRLRGEKMDAQHRVQTTRNGRPSAVSLPTTVDGPTGPNGRAEARPSEPEKIQPT